MKTTYTFFALFLFFGVAIYAQCADDANIYTFSYDGNDYQVVKENQTWEDAAACAVIKGGSLVRIDSAAEQAVIFSALSNDAGIVLSETDSPDGGGASYVWIGANDMASEGVWIWDGDNDGVGEQFWQGNASGSPIGGLYNNWGTEPDNYHTHQHAAAIALTQWPLGSGSLGAAGQWNDVYTESGAYAPNELYYLIEYVGGLAVDETDFDTAVSVFPNPTTETIFIRNNSDQNIVHATLFNQIGKVVNRKNATQIEKLAVSALPIGVYYLLLESEKGNRSNHLVLIE